MFFCDSSGVGGIRFPANSLPPEDLVMKAREYGVVTYFLKIPYLEFFFRSLTKFQKCTFKRIH